MSWVNCQEKMSWFEVKGTEMAVKRDTRKEEVSLYDRREDQHGRIEQIRDYTMLIG